MVEAPPCTAMRWLLAVLLLASLAGCADDSSIDDSADPTQPMPAPVGGNTTAESGTPVTVDVQLSGAYPVNIVYAPARIEVAAGSLVTIRFTNNDINPVPGHNWVLEGVDGAATEVIGNGETTEITFQAPAVGEYAFFCSVGNHRDVGMEGVFVVA